ncbi:hypothetical protein [Pseudoalteromonas luteoviolacea]|uniref:Uncharacterized protein n=1 Tax=Pseudoalteromonas luteoviolacea S4054 TaxID=1129367 RepID=A0A0F6A3K1_9GAMM|nr:hypothetical protein [Pseudoalteromonas luteoviolacea]AOT11183.1 hypothetical protein S4054249_25485 [Pseudoalteromonas luteoviolacea]AOT15653.1 hypothetical protein S40542_23025 [Pseudoalteromonas luteoviolacea]AOT21004.1 hypothetical protein S4054_25405 [Pseudoalteromonas luteoviolacea]KKE80795.1 hypothetical protein N479_24530 [Pseudoalteromonas luteoviolacea S4054]KZN71324.1 hypothetical protein N481_19250 [Pseudoalteromonas luteoviolacea S4047-1]
MKSSHYLTLTLLACISISGCGGSDNQASNGSGNTSVTKPNPNPNPNPKPEPGKKVADHSVKKSKLGGSRIQATSSGAHDLAATVSIVTNKASSENYSLSNAATN